MACLLGGILGGLLDYLAVQLNIPISFGMIIIMILVIWRIKKSFSNYHIWYSILAVVFLLIGLLFCIFAYYAIFMIVELKEYAIYKLFTMSSFWLNYVHYPINTLLRGIKEASPLEIILGILDVIIYAWAIFYTFTSIRDRRR